MWKDEMRQSRAGALCGLNADDAAYILCTFPIVREQDIKAFGRYRTQDDVLAALALLT